MNLEQIILTPITTLEYPDPVEARRYVDDEDGFYGYDYVFLEDATWHALCEIANERGCTVGQLCSHIDLNFANGGDFAPVARLYVLRYVADRIPPSVALPPELLFLRELSGRQRLQ
jgi:ribbon-helix-helix protein